MSGTWMIDGVPDHLTTSLPQRVRPIPVEDVAAGMKPCNDKEFEFWMYDRPPCKSLVKIKARVFCPRSGERVIG